MKYLADHQGVSNKKQLVEELELLLWKYLDFEWRLANKDFDFEYLIIIKILFKG